MSPRRSARVVQRAEVAAGARLREALAERRARRARSAAAAARRAPGRRTARSRRRSSCTRAGTTRAAASGSRRPPPRASRVEARETAAAELDSATTSRSSRPRRARLLTCERVAVREHPLAPPLRVGLEQRVAGPAQNEAASARSALCSACQSQVHRCGDPTCEDCPRWSNAAPGSPSPTAPGSPHGSGCRTSGPPRSLLEALPYRMDDLTAVVRLGVRAALRGGRLRRLPPRHPRHRLLRGHRRRTSTPPQEHADICRGDRLARRRRSGRTGRVGMYGTSYSGFNCAPGRVRAPARARCDRADLRVGRPLHRRRALHGRRAEGARPRRLRALHGRVQRPPARAGRRSATAGATSGRGASRAREPWLLRWLEEQADGPVLAARLAAPRLRADRVPDDDRRRAGPTGTRNITLPRASRRCACPKRAAARAVEPHVDGDLAAGPAHRPRARADPLVPPLARRRAERRRRRSRRSRSSCATRRRPSPTSPRCAASGAARPAGRPSGSRRSSYCADGRAASDAIARRVGDVGTAAWISCAGRLPWGQPDDQRVDDALLAHLRLGAARGSRSTCSGHPRAPRSRSPRRVPVAYLVGAALRRLPRRHLGARHAAALLNLTHRDGHDDPQPLEPGVRTDVELELEATSWVFEPGHGPARARRLRLAEHLAAPARRRRWPSTVERRARRCPCSTGRPRSPRPRPSAPPSGEDAHAPDTTREPAAGRLARRARRRSARETRAVIALRRRLRRPLRRARRGALRGRGRRLDAPTPATRGRTRPAPLPHRAGRRPTCATEARLDVRSDAEAYHVVVDVDRGGARRRTPSAAPSAASSARSRAGSALTVLERRDRRRVCRVVDDLTGASADDPRPGSAPRSRAAPPRPRRRAGSAGGSGSRSGSASGRAPRPARICCSIPSASGTTESSARVYGWRGLESSSSVGPELDDPAEVHDRDPVGDVPREPEVVRDDEDRDARRRGRARSISARISPRTDASRLETGSSATSSHGLEHHRPGDHDALALAAGDLVRVEPRRSAPAGAGRRRDSASATRASSSSVEPVDAQALGDRLVDRLPRVERARRVLEHHLHAARGTRVSDARVVAQRLALEPDLALRPAARAP